MRYPPFNLIIPSKPRWLRRLLITLDDWWWDRCYMGPKWQRSLAECWKGSGR